ncbi:hypothetical protein [Leptolyngbya sp. FACHB-17]|uniref:hypothetical protein n=1 Tax=unclassified Leptolyngbya TaxID=2650499 RepID=UPI001680FFE9|nr:hypothetical protein [Leptolyngbya sp. FACHB-17]MBD2078906.1 hypothetical protein [Leptolyngbya sp. FACHB-17]
MAYTNRPVTEAAVIPVAGDYHDRVRWGPIISGLMVALVSQLILSALGAAIGATSIANSGAPRTEAGGVGTAVGIWATISLLISLFIGSWVMARACGPMNRSTALLNGAILWATTLALSAYLLASGVTGAFGLAVSSAANAAGAALPQTGVPNVDPNAARPNISAQDARNIAGNTATAGWSFVIGSLLGLAASLAGAAVGTRKPRATTAYVEPNRGM